MELDITAARPVPNGRDWLTEEFHGEIMGRSCGNFGDLIINLMVFDSQDFNCFFHGIWWQLIIGDWIGDWIGDIIESNLRSVQNSIGWWLESLRGILNVRGLTIKLCGYKPYSGYSWWTMVGWVSYRVILSSTLWLFNIAMGNGLFIYRYLLIAWWFSLAMLNNQRVLMDVFGDDQNPFSLGNPQLPSQFFGFGTTAIGLWTLLGNHVVESRVLRRYILWPPCLSCWALENSYLLDMHIYVYYMYIHIYIYSVYIYIYI